MTNEPSTKIPFRDIKDHADLMWAFDRYIDCKITSIMYGWNNNDELAYMKSEIAHFLRIQSAQQGIAVESAHDVFEHGSEKGARINEQ